MLLADAFPTGYHATELVTVSPGDTVATFGAGVIGLLTASCALLRGAAQVLEPDTTMIQHAEAVNACSRSSRRASLWARRISRTSRFCSSNYKTGLRVVEFSAIRQP